MQFPYSFWGSVFKPTDVSNLFFWYKADSGITLNGGDVSAIADQSGVPFPGMNTKTLSQATAARQPLYNASAVNGYPAVEFTGANLDNLRNETNGWIVNGGAAAPAFSFFFVAKSTNNDPYQQVLGMHDTTSVPTTRWAIGMGDAASGWYGTSGVTTDFAPIAFPLNTYISRSFIKNAAGWNVYQNGSLALGPLAYPVITAPVTWTVFCMGNESNGAAYGLTGGIAEVIGYNVEVSAADRVRIEQYLRFKYNLY